MKRMTPMRKKQDTVGLQPPAGGVTRRHPWCRGGGRSLPQRTAPQNGGLGQPSLPRRDAVSARSLACGAHGVRALPIGIVILALCCAPFAAWAGTLATSSVDGGGGISSNGNLQLVASCGEIGGNITGVTCTSHSGLPCLQPPVSALKLSLGFPSMPTAGTNQVGGVATLNDQTLARLGGGDLAWNSAAYPFAALDSNGVLIALASISGNAATGTVSGLFQSAAASTAVVVYALSTVTVTAAGPGGTAAGGGTFVAGSNVVLTATASNGWVFTSWSDGNKTNPRTLTVPAGGGTYSANFATAATLTLLANPTNAAGVSGGGLYAIGATASIAAPANLSWRFLRWSDGNPTNARAYLVVSNITLTANFTNAAHIYMQDQVGNVTKWAINNTNTLQQYDTFGGMGAWNLKGIGDVTHDGKADLFWQMTSGWVVAYLSQTNSSYQGVGLGNLGAWELRAAADVDGDGIADLIWQLQDPKNGWITVWLMNSNCTQRTGYSLGNLGVWRLKGAGDINGDGKADLILQTPMGDVVVWLSQPGGTYQGLGVGNLGAWELRTVHDVDGDGIADLLWQNPGGWTVVWYMNTNGAVRAGVGLGNIYIGTTINKIMAVE